MCRRAASARIEMRPSSRSTATMARSTSSSGGACAPEPASSPGLDVMTSMYRPAMAIRLILGAVLGLIDHKFRRFPSNAHPAHGGSWSVRHRGEDLLLGERQRAHADTEGVAEGVANGRGGGTLRSFSDA